MSSYDDNVSHYNGWDKDSVVKVMRLHGKLDKALKYMTTIAPMYTSLALDLDQFFEKGQVGSLARVNHVRITWNVELFEDLSVKEVAFVMAHEIMHVALQHHWRMGDKDHRTWNIATDLVINSALTDDGMLMPEGLLLDRQFDGLSAEQVYGKIRSMSEDEKAQQGIPQEPGKAEDNDPDAPEATSKLALDAGEDGSAVDEKSDADCAGSGGPTEPEDGDAGMDGEAGPSEAPEGPKDDKEDPGDQEDGSGSPEAPEDVSEDAPAPESHQDQEKSSETPEEPKGQPPPEAWNVGQVEDATEGLSEAEVKDAQAEEEIRVQAAAIGAKSVGASKGDTDRIINARMVDLPFSDQIMSFLSDSKTKDDYTFARPNRRYMNQGIYMPSMGGSSSNDIVFGVDTSGSIDIGQLNHFAEILSAAVVKLQIDSTHVIFCDTRVQKVLEVGLDDMPLNLKPKGGGGTRFSPVFDYIQDKNIPCKAVIYFTDLQCHDYPANEPDFPVLWVCFDSYIQTNSYWCNKVPWGQVIIMDPNNPEEMTIGL